jgi:hypothetical protein
MKPVLFTDNSGKPVLVDGDSVVLAAYVEWTEFPNCQTWIKFQYGQDTFVQESVEKVFEALKG